jgi:hypothetical protein
MTDRLNPDGCPECQAEPGADHKSYCHAPCRDGAAKANGRVVMLSSALDALLADQGVNEDGSYALESQRRAEELLESIRG